MDRSLSRLAQREDRGHVHEARPPVRRRPRQHRLFSDRPGPIVRWAGGKSRLLEQILPLLPRTWKRYIEPFCGGGALFFRLRPARSILSDNNSDLIELYREVARDPLAVHREISAWSSSTDPLIGYYGIRAAWNASRGTWSSDRRAATFLYLNRCCYNGVWRVNRAGEFNVPCGTFDSGPSFPQRADLVAVSERLRSSEISHGDFRDVFTRALPGDLIYADPPYVPVCRTSFTKYSASGFTEKDQRDLATVALSAIARGVMVAISQSDTVATREIYAGLVPHPISALRSVNSRGSGRGRVAELLLTGGYA